MNLKSVRAKFVGLQDALVFKVTTLCTSMYVVETSGYQIVTYGVYDAGVNNSSYSTERITTRRTNIKRNKLPSGPAYENENENDIH